MALQLNAGDTAWILACCSLVLLMTPALALFYGGMVRRKNVLSTLTLSYVFMALIGVQWVLYGYSLAFGADIEGLVGGLNYLGFAGVGALPNGDYSKTIPHGLFAAFQMMFAVITPALITGAFVERIKFKAFLLFSLLWATLVYDPLCHWVWGQGGWLKQMGVLDFAGGTVVHIAAGFSALAFAMVIGPRKGFGKSPMEPGNIPLTVIGAGLLWVGWFGFNAGSALAANDLAANAFVTTHIATAAAGLTWALIEWQQHGKPTVLGTVTGAVAGLVAITPACGFVNPMNAIFIGMTVALICYLAIAVVKARLGYDDALDAFGVHGVGGIWGTIAVGLFAEKAVNAAGADGLFFGGAQLWPQCIMAVAAPLFAGVMTFVIYKLVDTVMCARVKEKDETIGLDLTQQSEAAYTVIE